MNTCIYSKAQFYKAPGEDILQNFLGARWTDEHIVCDDVQKAFGHSIDPAFEKGVKPIRTLLATKSGRGGAAPPLRGVETVDGHTVNLKAGGQGELARPRIKVDKIGANQHNVSISVDPKHVEWVIADLKKQLPQLALTAADLLNVGHREHSLQSPLKIEIRPGGSEYIRGVLKAGFNLLAAKGIQVLAPEFDPVRDFILSGNGRISDFFRWPKRNIALNSKLGPVDHFIGIMGRGDRVDGVMNLYGNFAHSMRFASKYSGNAFKVGYAVDPLREAHPAENRNPDFADDAVLDFDQQPVKPGKESWATFSAAITSTLRAHKRLVVQWAISGAVDEVLGKPDGRPITAEQTNQIRSKISERLFGIKGQ